MALSNLIGWNTNARPASSCGASCSASEENSSCAASCTVNGPGCTAGEPEEFAASSCSSCSGE